MHTRTFLLTVLLTIGFSFHNCSDPFDCGDFGDIPDFFDIRGFRLDHLDRDNSRTIDSGLVDYDEYGFLRMIFDVEYVAYQEQNHWDFSLMNSAYSCTPPEAGTEGAKEEALANLTVITLNDFDENHFANDTLNDLISIGYRHYESLDLTTFLAAQEGNVEREVLYLSLESRPTLNQDFQVRVRVDLSNGERYEEISPVITFQ